MILTTYFIILFIVIYLTRKSGNRNIEKTIVWLYNYIFAFFIFLTLGYLALTTINLNSVILIILNAIYSAFRGVTFDLGFQNYRDVFHLLGNDQIVEIQIWLILLIASLNTAGTLSVLLFSEKIHQFKLWYLYNRQANKILVVGDSPNAYALIDDIYSKDDYKNKVITYYTNIEVNQKESRFRKVRIRKLEDFIIDNPIENGKPSHQYDIILMLKDKNENIQYLGKLNEIAKNAANNPDDTIFSNIRITAICNNEQLRFHDLNGIKLDAYLVSEAQLVVDKLRESHSPLEVISKNEDLYEKDSFKIVKEPYSVCVIGFGELGQELLLSAYENSRFLREDLSESPFRALVIDKNMSWLKQDFLTDVPYFKNKEHIEFCDTSIGAEEFYREIEARLPHIHQFFIATGDDSLNLDVAYRLSRFIRNKKLKKDKPEIIFFIRAMKYDQESLTSQSEMLYAVNIYKDIYTYDNLILRKADELGKQVHESYKEYVKDKKVKDWIELNVFTKDSNRASAKDVVNKLGLIDKEFINEDVCWKLAIYEHYRWCAFHYSRGWTSLLPEELTEIEKNNNISKREYEKKHLCLVDWDELSRLPCQNSSTAFQEYDYEVVTRLLDKYKIKEVAKWD